MGASPVKVVFLGTVMASAPGMAAMATVGLSASVLLPWQDMGWAGKGWSRSGSWPTALLCQHHHCVGAVASTMVGGTQSSGVGGPSEFLNGSWRFSCQGSEKLLQWEMAKTTGQAPSELQATKAGQAGHWNN